MAAFFDEIHSTQGTIFLLTVAVGLLVYLLIRSWNGKRYAPGPVGLPVLGNLLSIGKDPTASYDKWWSQYGDVFRIRLGSWEAVVINGYRTIKAAADQKDDFSGRPGFIAQNMIKEINGDHHIAFGPFDSVYREQRKIAATVLRRFTGKEKDRTEDLLKKESNILADTLLSKSKGSPVNVIADVQFGIGRVVYKFMYGRFMGDPDDDDHLTEIKKMIDGTNKFSEFVKNGNPVDVIPVLRFVFPNHLLKLKQLLTDTVRVTQTLLSNRVVNFRVNDVKDVTDAAFEGELTKGGDQAKVVLKLTAVLTDIHGASIDTTSRALQWLILYMAEYPDIQERVRQEIGNHIDQERDVCYKDSARLVYTEATIYETLRVAVPIPFCVPKAATRDTTINGYDVDKDTVVIFNLRSASFEKSFWGDPGQFRPERLITADNTLDDTKLSHIIPFSLGRRNCVGELFAKMELFVIFSTLIRRCRFVKPNDIVYDFTPDPGLTYMPKDFKVIVEPPSK